MTRYDKLIFCSKEQEERFNASPEGVKNAVLKSLKEKADKTEHDLLVESIQKCFDEFYKVVEDLTKRVTDLENGEI